MKKIPARSKPHALRSKAACHADRKLAEREFGEWLIWKWKTSFQPASVLRDNRPAPHEPRRSTDGATWSRRSPATDLRALHAAFRVALQPNAITPVEQTSADSPRVHKACAGVFHARPGASKPSTKGGWHQPSLMPSSFRKASKVSSRSYGRGAQAHVQGFGLKAFAPFAFRERFRFPACQGRHTQPWRPFLFTAKGGTKI